MSSAEMQDSFNSMHTEPTFPCVGSVRSRDVVEVGIFEMFVTRAWR